MKFLFSLLLAFFFTPLFAMPMADAINSFLGLNERDIDIRSDPREYKRRRWLKPEERWGNLPTSTLSSYPWQTGGWGGGGGGGGNGGHHHHFPIPGPWHHHKGHHKHNLPWPFGEVDWPFSEKEIEGWEKELYDTEKEITKEIFDDA